MRRQRVPKRSVERRNFLKLALAGAAVAVGLSRRDAISGPAPTEGARSSTTQR